VELLLKLSCE